MKKNVWALAIIVLFGNVAAAEDAKLKEFTLVIKNHVFTPARLEVAAGEQFNLIVDNQDATAEEFESHDLSREKIIKGNSKAVIKIGALKAGEYKFFGEFNEKTAQGILVAK